MHRSLFVIALFGCATAALAQNTDVIKARQALYKGMGAATKEPAGMLKGAPFDLKAVDAALDTYIDAAKKLPGLFPDDSKTGEKTQALPAIWEHKEDFTARLAKFGADAAAAKAAITDETSLKANFTEGTGRLRRLPQGIPGPGLMDRPTRAAETASAEVQAWDLPTRLFHWVLVALLISAYLTRTYSNDPTLYWHRINGYAILALLLFRLMWGFAGSSTSRFAAFLPWPGRAWRYATALLRGRPRHYLGHNPLGAALIYLMLLAIAAQATAGLFTTDDVIAEGPLHKFASDAVAARAAAFHAKGFWIILGLAAVHIAANLGYQVFGADRLVTAMVTGRKPALAYADAPRARLAPAWRALVCAAVAVGLVVGGVMVAGDTVLQ